MNSPEGSAWHKWDLHVHTPASIVNSYGGGGDGQWDTFIEALSRLPEEIAVLGINDYIFLEGYKKVLAAKNAGQLPNIRLLLPVIEFRLDKFGGSKSGLSRVNYHVIFSDVLSPELIESQFLNALCSKYVLSPAFEGLHGSSQWAALPTRESLADLGRLIIDSVPEAERKHFKTPLIEGFNNLCLSLHSIKALLDSPYFSGKTLTAVGKTEWADIKWNDQSIADKKTIINGADLVFISSASVDDWQRAHKSLVDSEVNSRLLDCSDAHQYEESESKDRLGNCFTWIKADTTFEGLRQAVYEYQARVRISQNSPIAPLLRIKKVTLKFPDDTKLIRGELQDDFCFRGTTAVSFSPYLTCIIGGRGTGKSTLLNLIHEKLDPGSTNFFEENKTSPDEAAIEHCVDIEGISEQKLVEFLQQNEIEQFATDHKKLTLAIFARLQKLETNGVLEHQEAAIRTAILATQKQLSKLDEYHQKSAKLAQAERELATNRGLLASFQNAEYKGISSDLATLNKTVNGLKVSRGRLDTLIEELQRVLADYVVPAAEDTEPLNAYESAIRDILNSINVTVDQVNNNRAIADAELHEEAIQVKIGNLRAALNRFLKDRGLSTENLADVGKAGERIAELVDEILSLKERVSTLGKEMLHFSSRRDVADNYFTEVQNLLEPINLALKAQGAEVKPIELQYKFDVSYFREEMIRFIAKDIGLIEGRTAREDFLENKLKNLDFSFLGAKDHAIRQIADNSTVYGRALREYLNEGVNFEKLKLRVEIAFLDCRKFGKMHVLYDGRPVENSSFGQRCTAVIVILLLLGNMPIVIDEPEAHLDSSLIARYLVNLIQSQKVHRQIIFATHNANVVINGDAELIHCFSMDGEKKSKITSTTIENLKHRDTLLALEGGERAFQQRERRYGIA